MWLGDSHNFGKRVQLITDERDRSFVLKPRSIFWEYQLLDMRSPLRQRYQNLFSAIGINIDSCLGDVEYTSTDGYKTGFCQKIEMADAEPSRALAANMGLTLALCLSHGLVDLHKENVAILEDRFQILDIEMIFSNIQLASQTILVPSIILPTQICGFKQLFSPSALPDRSFWISVIDSFLVAMRSQTQMADAMAEAWLELNDLKKHPVRILLRSTSEYGSTKDTKYIESENAQLLRGDIPYYFGFLGTRDVYYYSGPDLRTQVDFYSNEFDKKVGISFGMPSDILNTDRLQKICKLSALQLARNVMNFENTTKLHGDEFNAHFAGNDLILVTKEFSLKTPITRRVS